MVTSSSATITVHYGIGHPGVTYGASWQYLSMLERAVTEVLDGFQPDLVLFDAGADVFQGSAHATSLSHIHTHHICD